MAYKFDFDLTRVSNSFFKEIVKFSDRNSIHRKIGNVIESAVDKFKIQSLTGLPVSDAVKVINDLLDIHAKNLSNEEEFKKSDNRALFLPHCSRKYMDRKCQAEFNPELSTYDCRHCSEDCLVSKTSKIGEDRGYEIYILPGGSCIPRILNKKNYDAVVGVACPHEIKLSIDTMGEEGIPYQAIPLLKNGCSETKFSMETFEKVIGCNSN